MGKGTCHTYLTSISGTHILVERKILLYHLVSDLHMQTVVYPSHAHKTMAIIIIIIDDFKTKQKMDLEVNIHKDMIKTK